MKEQTITKTVYIADDGKQFERYGECFAYEEGLWAEEAKKTMNIVKLDVPGFLEYGEETFWLAKVKSTEEMQMVNDFFKKHYDNVDDFSYKQERTIYVVDITDCGNVYCWGLDKEELRKMSVMHSQFIDIVTKGEDWL